MLKRRTFSFLPSEDVHRQFPELKHATEARYRISLPLEFLEANEYVLRFCLLEDGRVKSRLWDLAFIRDEVFIKPIFVVGSPRAGTTAVGNSLREALDAKNYGEHHFLFLAKLLEEAISDYFKQYHTRNDKGTFINDISPPLVQLKTSQQIKEIYSSWHTGAYFVDKTPGRNMLRSIPTIQQIWPESRCIFCKRRAYENVKSRLMKFPHLEPMQHAKQWVEVMELWRELKKTLDSNSFIEIDQFDLINDSQRVRKALAFLFGSEVAKGTMSSIASKFPQQSKYSAEITDQDIDCIREICSEEMRFWGYDANAENYYMKAK